MTDLDKVIELFSKFTRQRQTGRSRDQAWNDLKAEVETLSKAHRERLLVLCKGWEVKEGRNYPSHEDPFDTHFKPPEGIEVLRQTETAGSAPKLNVIKRIKPLEASPGTPVSAPAGTECPACHTVNPEGEFYCRHCGTLLAKAEGLPNLTDTRPLAGVGMPDTSYFGEDSVLYLRVRGSDRPLQLRIGSNEVMIGRRAPDSVMVPDIDLSPYQADAKGVSRLHAALRRHGETLMLSDMGSMNYTYVNGQRLHAHEVRALHDGDEIRLGQLPLQVFFRKE